MSDPATRHRDAVKYNRVMAEAAEKHHEELSDPDVLKWVSGISRLHRYHERRHAESLRKLEEKNDQQVESSPAEKTIEEQQTEVAAEQEKKAEVDA